MRTKKSWFRYYILFLAFKVMLFKAFWDIFVLISLLIDGNIFSNGMQ